MTHYLLDTNALLRYLLNDIPQQTKEVEKLVIKAKQLDVTVTILVAVIMEVVFALLKFYHESKESIGAQLFTLASSPILDIEKREVVKKALLIWKTENISFVDSLVLAQAQEEAKTLFTFDKKLKRLAKTI